MRVRMWEVPTTLWRATLALSLARHSAVFLPTPPNEENIRPMLLSAVTRGALDLLMMSRAVMPTTTISIGSSCTSESEDEV